MGAKGAVAAMIEFGSSVEAPKNFSTIQHAIALTTKSTPKPPWFFVISDALQEEEESDLDEDAVDSPNVNMSKRASKLSSPDTSKKRPSKQSLRSPGQVEDPPVVDAVSAMRQTLLSTVVTGQNLPLTGDKKSSLTSISCLKSERYE